MPDQPDPSQTPESTSDASPDLLAESVLSSAFEAENATTDAPVVADDGDVDADPAPETTPEGSAAQPPADPLDQLGDQYLAAMLGKGFTRKQVAALVRDDGAESVQRLAHQLYASQKDEAAAPKVALDPTDADLGIQSESDIAAKYTAMGVDDEVAAKVAKSEYAEKKALALKTFKLEQQIAGNSKQTEQQRFMSEVQQYAAAAPRSAELYGTATARTAEQTTNVNDMALLARAIQTGVKTEFQRELPAATAAEFAHLVISGRNAPAAAGPSPKAQEKAAKRHENRDIASTGTRAGSDIETDEIDGAEAVLARAFNGQL